MGCPHLEVKEGINKHIASEAFNFQNNLENQNNPAPAYQNIPTLDKLKEDLKVCRKNRYYRYFNRKR